MTQRREDKMIYAYYMTQRPPMPGAMPSRGLLSAEEFSVPVSDGNIGRIYGKISYDRKLSTEEIYNYELTPVPEKKLGQRKVMEVRDSGILITVIKKMDDRYTPYRIYKHIDKYHKRQIAKCADLASAVKTVYEYIINGN